MMKKCLLIVLIKKKSRVFNTNSNTFIESRYFYSIIFNRKITFAEYKTFDDLYLNDNRIKKSVIKFNNAFSQEIKLFETLECTKKFVNIDNEKDYKFTGKVRDYVKDYYKLNELDINDLENLCEIDLETITEEKDYHDDIEKFELNEKNKETYLSFLNIYKGNTIDAKEAMKNYSKFANINDDDLLEEHEYLEKIYDISKKIKKYRNNWGK